MILINTQIHMYVCLPVIGVFSWTTRRPKVDYSKWLGPDWKPTYEGASMLVSNHTGFAEIALAFMFIRPMPGFIAKKIVKQVPSIAPIAIAVGTLFLEHADKNNLNAIFKQI